jgi:hypothetical protein
MYRLALGGEEDFEARSGLVYAFIAAGDLRNARAERALLKPSYPYQEKEIAELDRALRGAARPAADAGYAYYDDSDGNRVDKYQASISAWVYAARIGLDLRRFDARDDTRKNAARGAAASVSARLGESLGLGASAGYQETRNGDTEGFPTGSARVELLVPRGAISGSASRELMAETAQLISNSVRVSAYQLSLSQYLGGGVTADGSFAYREFSDDNRSRDLQLSARYAFDIKTPAASVGYRFRYRDFSRESGNGYFDPGNYQSHQLFLGLSHEGKRIVAVLEPYTGYEEFDRQGKRTRHWIGGGTGSLGVIFREGWILEANFEGGTNSSGAAAGFDYYQAGVRLRAAF